MVAIAIIAIVMAIAAPRYFISQPHQELAAAHRQIISALAQARRDAIRLQRPSTLTLDVQKGLWRVTSQSKPPTTQGEIPKNIYIEMTAAGSLATTAQGGVRFFPDGSSSGARIILQSSSEQKMIMVDWRSGLVTPH